MLSKKLKLKTFLNANIWAKFHFRVFFILTFWEHFVRDANLHVLNQHTILNVVIPFYYFFQRK
jgi:hypothetical protein